MSDGRRDKQFEKAWRNRFAEFAALRDDDAGIAGWSTTGLQSRFRFFASIWKAAPAGTLYIDVGCGAGTYARWLANRGMSVIGLDYSLPSLEKARQRTSENVAYCASDAAQLPLASASVDGALCLGVMQAVSDSRPLVLELARVLRPGGEVWVDTLNASGLRSIWDRTGRRLRGRPMHLRYVTAQDLMANMRSAGFDDLMLYWLPLMPARLGGLQELVESRVIRFALDSVPRLAAIACHCFIVRGVLNGAGRSKILRNTT